MEDHEVGELWRALHQPQTGLMDDDRYIMIELIRKLMQREKLHRPTDAYWLILRDFAIDASTWPLEG